MNKEFIQAIDDLERERHISKDVLIEAIESALVSAYKKNYGTAQNVRVDIDRETGDIAVLMRMDVVDEIEDELTQISVEEAREIDYRYQAGDIVEYQVTPRDFGRIAAQTAKQVVVQRIREAERGMIFDDYVTRQGEIVTGSVQRISNETMFINIGRTEGILSANEQVPGERYKINDRLKVYIMDVKKTTKGPQVFLSRSHPGLVKRLFRAGSAGNRRRYCRDQGHCQRSRLKDQDGSIYRIRGYRSRRSLRRDQRNTSTGHCR